VKKYLIIISAIILFVIAFQVEGITITFENPLEPEGDIGDMISGIIDFIFTVAIILVPLMIVIGAFFYLSSGGDASKIQLAKKIIIYALIGFLIIACAEGIIYLIESLLGIQS
jgi:hypothetical protein